MTEPAIKRRHFTDEDDSPEAITMNAIAADAMSMRIAGPKWADATTTKKELAHTLAVSVDLILRELYPLREGATALDADTLERELVRVAALCVRLIERR